MKERRGNSFTVAGTIPIHNGDGLVFFNAKGEMQGFRVNRAESNRVFPFEMPELPAGTALFRNYDQAFERQLSKPSAERKIGLAITFRDTPDGFALSLQDESGAKAEVAEACTKAPAQSPQEENIRLQLSKLGGTPFEATSVETQLSAPWFVPSSLLAGMRRKAVEALLAERTSLYLQNRPTRRPTETSAQPSVEADLSYLWNVSNSQAEAFYRERGAQSIAPSFERAPQEDVPLMFSKHCLRYSMGYCPSFQKQQSPWQEPYYLLHKNMRFRLQFDCKHCQMLIFAEKLKNNPIIP
jgi:putative protease